VDSYLESFIRFFLYIPSKLPTDDDVVVVVDDDDDTMAEILLEELL